MAIPPGRCNCLAKYKLYFGQWEEVERIFKKIEPDLKRLSQNEVACFIGRFLGEPDDLVGKDEPWKRPKEEHVR